MLIDCFPFFNELDLLEIRLNSLASHVDRFILCESPETHSGKPKPLFFEENKERYKDFPITHLVSPVCTQLKRNDDAGNMWRREHFQREYLMEAVKWYEDDTTVMLSDADEIPNLDAWDGRFGLFRLMTYYYCLNLCSGIRMVCTGIKPKREITSLNRMIHWRNIGPVIGDGWQFSTLGNAEEIRYKIESFAHAELQTPEFLDSLKERRENLTDPFAGGAPNWRQKEVALTRELPSGPKWLLQNLDERYKHLLC